MISHYNEVEKEIESLNISLLNKITTFIFSLFLSLMIIIGPITFLLNLSIYVNLRKLIAMGVWFLISLLVFLTDFFYLKGITKNKIKRLYNLYIPNTAILSFVLLVFILILFLMGVI